MSKSKHSEAEMIGALKQLEAGRKAEDVAREVGVSKHTIYAWKAKYGGMDVSQAQEAKQLRDENTKLRKLVADLSLDKEALQGTSAPNFSNSSLSGQYTIGTRDEAGKSESEVGQFDFTSPGAYSAIGDLVTAGESKSQPDVGGNSGTVFVNGDGSGTFGTGPAATIIVTNGPLIVGIDGSTSATQPLLYILVAHTAAP